MSIRSLICAFIFIYSLTSGGLLKAETVLGTGAASSGSTVNLVSFDVGIQFTTGIDPANITSIDLGIARSNVGAGTMTWVLFADGGTGTPGPSNTVLATETVTVQPWLAYVSGNPATLTNMIFTGNIANYTLNPSTSYFLVITQVSTNQLEPKFSNSPSSGSPNSGWTTTGNVYVSNGGTNWAGIGPFVYNINATLPSPPAPPGPPQPIPTLSEWAQIMMMLAMIATAGFYGWRMKQR